MKLPRWLMMTFLGSSVLAALFGATRIWTMWPVQTAFEFVAAMREGDIAGVLQVEPNYMPSVREKRTKYEWPNVIWQRRRLGDIFCGRQHFQVAGEPFLFTVERGRVSRMWQPGQ